MAELTLLEAGKLMEPSKKAGIIDIYARAYQPMQVAPVISTEGKASYTWNDEDDLPYDGSGGSRNVGADFTATAGNSKPYESDVKIYGGKIQVDEYIQDHSPASVQFQESGQIKAHAKKLTTDIFEGEGGTNLRGFRHWMLYDSAYQGQEVSAGVTDNGVLLDTTMVDELIEKVKRGPDTYFYCTENTMLRLKYISKGQQSNEPRMVYEKNEFGMWAWAYDGIPVVVLKDGKNNNLLSTTEADSAGNNNSTTSLYIVSWGIENAALFSSSTIIGENGVPLPKVLKQNDGTNYVYTRMTWYVGLTPHEPRSIGRVRYIKDAIK
jgi:hypothetical protein